MQRELDRLGATLRQIEAYNESMKGEIAVTRRAAYAAEEAMQKLEKEKQQQDYLIDDLQVCLTVVVGRPHHQPSLLDGLTGMAEANPVCCKIGDEEGSAETGKASGEAASQCRPRERPNYPSAAGFCSCMHGAKCKPRKSSSLSC